MSSVIRTSVASGQAWSSRPLQLDPARRRQIFGPVLPMEQPGLLSRLFARR